MRERGAIIDDVCRALVTSTSATWQAEHLSWRVSGGVDLDGDGLTIVVDIEADVIVITLS